MSRGSKTYGNTSFSNLEGFKPKELHHFHVSRVPKPKEIQHFQNLEVPELKEIQHFQISRLPNLRKYNIFKISGCLFALGTDACRYLDTGRPYIVIAYELKPLLANCEFHVHISLREQSQIDKRLKAFIQPGSNSSGLTSSESLGCHFAPGEPWSQRGLGGSMIRGCLFQVLGGPFWS